MTHSDRIKHALDHLLPLRDDAASHPEVLTDQRENWRLLHLDAAIDLLLGRGSNVPKTRKVKR